MVRLLFLQIFRLTFNACIVDIKYVTLFSILVTPARLNNSTNSVSDDRGDTEPCNTSLPSILLEAPRPGVKLSTSPSPSLASQRAETDKSKSDGSVKDGSVKEYDESSEFVKIEKKSSTVKTLISHFISGPGAQIIQVS